jgi:hypothetical protein
VHTIQDSNVLYSNAAHTAMDAGPQIYMKETIFYVFHASSVIFDARND